MTACGGIAHKSGSVECHVLYLILVAVVLYFAVAYYVVDYLAWESPLAVFSLIRIPDAEIADLVEQTDLQFPNSAVLVDAYVSSLGVDAVFYYRARMRRRDIEEFMQQEALAGTWREGNAMADYLPDKLRERWRALLSARECSSSGYDRGDPGVVITVCLDGGRTSTVYFLVHYW